MSTTTVSRTDLVHDELQRALLRGEIHPDARLTEPKVSAFFNVSRTPVREALNRLAAEGLLARYDYGFAPVRPTLAGVRDLYELRSIIELAGIERIAASDSLGYHIAPLEAQHKIWADLKAAPPEQDSRLITLDETFHLALLVASGNSELVHALESVNLRIRQVRMHDYIVHSRVDATVTEHLAIVEALLAADFDRGIDLLREHIGASSVTPGGRIEQVVSAMLGAEVPATGIGVALR